MPVLCGTGSDDGSVARRHKTGLPLPDRSVRPATSPSRPDENTHFDSRYRRVAPTTGPILLHTHTHTHSHTHAAHTYCDVDAAPHSPCA
jgi:hypothetical protein